MTLPRSAADVLSGHVTFEVECIDRMYLNVYIPQLQYATGLVSYIHRHLGKPVASTAALAPVTGAFTRAVRAFAAGRQIPWVDFARGQRKDDVAQKFLAGFTGTDGVLFTGRAQEKVPLFRTRKRRRGDGIDSDAQVGPSLLDAREDQQLHEAGKQKECGLRRHHGGTGRQIESIRSRQTRGARRSAHTPRNQQHGGQPAGKDRADDGGHDQQAEYEQHARRGHRARHHDAERQEKGEIARPDCDPRAPGG